MRKYPVWSYIVAVITGLCLLIVILLTSFQLTVFNRGFVDREMQKFGVAGRVGMTQEGLMDLYEEVLRYLEDKRDDLDIQVERYGNSVPAFHEKEILHMVDVEALFRGGFLLRDVCAVLAVISIVALCLLRKWRVLLRGFIIAAIVFFLAILVVGIAILVDFDHAFILFHQIFFTNDLWQLDYATDLLMNIVPEPFSYDVAIRTILYFLVVFVPLMVADITLLIVERRGGLNRAGGHRNNS